jgi:monoamine oxidase
MTEIDIAIVGAGAAGLAAAEAVAASPLSCALLEARDRVGGRAHTLASPAGPLDLGAAWLHSANHNPLVARFQTLGLTIDRTPPPWERLSDSPTLPPADQIEFGRSFEAYEERLAKAAHEPDDAPASVFLEPGNRWNPLLNAFSAFYNGAEFDQVSVHDYGAYDDSEVNWRVAQGYGAGVAALAPSPTSDIAMALSCPVSRIRHDGARLELDTPRGVLSARAVIICVPTAILSGGGLSFFPALPDKVEAAAGLPLGLADKVFLGVDEPEAFAAETMLYGAPHKTATGSYHLRPFHRPMIEAFLGGAHARALEGEGPGAAADFAIEELVAIYGTGLRSRIHVLTQTAWAADPYALGSYSHALPGHAGDRARLAAPVGGRLFFAGEACSADAFSTVHGAWLTGREAGRQAIAALGV